MPLPSFLPHYRMSRYPRPVRVWPQTLPDTDCLELEAPNQLQDPWLTSACDPAKCARGAPVSPGLAKMWMVGQIELLNSELEFQPLTHRETSLQARVSVEVVEIS